MLEEGPEKKTTVMDSAVREFARRGLLLCVAFFVIEVVLYFVISSLPFFPGEQALYTTQKNQIGNEFQGAGFLTTFWGIFTNNYRIALIEFIPIIGLFLFFLSIYATSRIVEVEAIGYSLPPAILVLNLFFYPHSYIELPAYAVATAEGVVLLLVLVRWLRDTGDGRHQVSWGREGAQFAINLVIVTVMLLVAAVFESVEIQIELDYPKEALLPLVTWIPFAVVIVGVVLLNKRLSRIRKEATLSQAMVQ